MEFFPIETYIGCPLTLNVVGAHQVELVDLDLGWQVFFSIGLESIVSMLTGLKADGVVAGFFVVIWDDQSREFVDVLVYLVFVCHSLVSSAFLLSAHVICERCRCLQYGFGHRDDQSVFAGDLVEAYSEGLFQRFNMVGTDGSLRCVHFVSPIQGEVSNINVAMTQDDLPFC